MMISLVTDLEIASLSVGLATMCIGVGQGIAVLVERA